MHLAFAALLFAASGGTPPPELDTIPVAIRERAAMIFVAKYVTRRGDPVYLRDGQEWWELRARFEVKSSIFGHVPDAIEVNPAELPPKSAYIDEARGNQTYLVLLGLSNDVLALVRLGPKAEHVEIADYGRYEREPDEPHVDAPDTTSGYLNVVAAETQPTLLDRTDTIEATIGTMFGMQFLAEGRARDNDDEDDDDDDGVAPIHIRVLHPPMTDPKTKKVTTKEEWDAPANLGIIRFTGWTFETESELVPGRWTIEILQDGRVMASRNFTITAVAPPSSSSPARTRTRA